MNKKTVTVQLTLDDNDLYFRDLGELLSRHVTELCSKGNFGHDFAAGIYRALADQLENAEFDDASSEDLEQMARKGFEETMYGTDEPKVNFGIGGDDWARSIERNFRESKEARRLNAILEKYIPEVINGNPMQILKNDILPLIEDFKRAQSLLQAMVAKKGVRIEKCRAEWKKLASVDEILNEEDKIVFCDDVLTDYGWSWLIKKCFKYSILEATENEILDFVTIYEKLPDGFQISDREINDLFVLWIQELRGELQERLGAGMFIEDIRAFDQEHGLADLGISIKSRVECLERSGIVSKGKQKNKVFYSLRGAG